MENQFFLRLSKHFKGKIVDKEMWRNLIGKGGSLTKIKTDDPRSLREWWYEILRNYGKYPCYAIFLVLPSDKEITEFLKGSGRELHTISDNYCLIIVLGSDFFCTIGLNDEYSVSANTDHITTGESVQIAKLFNIELTEFPTMVFFEDIRSSDFAIVSLQNLGKDEINRILREVFTVIRKQETNSKKIIESIRNYSKLRKFQRMKHQATQTTTTLISKTIEMIIEAWIKAVIK